MRFGVVWGALALAVGAASVEQENQRRLAAQSTGNSQGYQGSIWVSNQCGRAVDLWIYFQNANTGNWESRGKWSFSNGERSFLSSNNMRLKTTHPTLYYAISPSFSSFGLSHAGTFTHNGIRHQYRKVVDTEGDTEIRLCVN